MAAHLREIHVELCDRHGCAARATQVLFNTWNARLGSFCTRHATVALNEHRRAHE